MFALISTGAGPEEQRTAQRRPAASAILVLESLIRLVFAINASARPLLAFTCTGTAFLKSSRTPGWKRAKKKLCTQETSALPLNPKRSSRSQLEA